MRISFKGNRPWENPAHMPSMAAAYGSTYKDRIRALLKKDAVILDTETTSIKGDVRVIELSIVDLEGNVIFNSLFDPGMPLPADIPALTGITDEMLEDQPRFAERTAEISDCLRGKTIIAWNADFDRKWTFFEFIKAGFRLDAQDWVDAMELYARMVGHRTKYYRLIKAKEDMRIGESQEHRATADCLDTLAVLKAAAALKDDLLDMTGEDAE